MHIVQGQHVEFARQLTPRLQQVIKGIMKAQAATKEAIICRPITLPIMRRVMSALQDTPQSYFNSTI